MSLDDVKLPAQVLAGNGETAKSDDPAKFAPKGELLATLEAQLKGVAEKVAAMDDGEFDEPSPDKLAKLSPTLGGLALMLPLHLTMHIGQIQVIRRSLGKPVLF